MLFNSSVFIFGFVPLTLIGFFLLARWGSSIALAWLTAASLFFYGWWNAAWLPLMLASIAFNFTAGRAIAMRSAPAPGGAPPALSARTLVTGAIAANLGLLVYYKYAGFIVANLADWTGSSIRWHAGELPLGISFFTFTQIAFLVDVYQRKAADFNPIRYGLFVTYYPHLIAGPILHHKEMMPQFAKADIFRFDAGRLADGSVIFILGLFKKAVLADQFGRYATRAFGAATQHDLSFYESWGAALAYTLQIYFDFSGYSDMAIGLALMIGIHLPANFYSPYKSLNVAEFWRRWHMTLSRFLRDYLYIPLGGNRKGAARRHVNLMVTMLLGGLWHGAGWTFVVWGALHGAYLVVCHAWQHATGRWWPQGIASWLRGPTALLSWLLTFLAVVVAWVFFRAADMPTALSILKGMSGMHGAYLPDQLLAFLPPLRLVASGVGTVPYLADGTVLGAVEMMVMLILGLAIALFTPALSDLRPRWRYLLVVPCAALAFQRVLYGGGASEFLYFQF